MSSGKTYLTAQKYFKPNYYEAVKYIIPNYLTEDDIENFGQEFDLRDEVLNGNIRLANDFGSLIKGFDGNVVSSVEATVYSSIDTVSGISEFFIKQNDLTNITTRKFQDKILTPLGISINDYATSSDFATYLSGTLLPSIALNKPTATFVDSHSASDTHNYLISNLSWVYLLNTSGPGGTFDPSTAVAEEVVNTIYKGQPFETVNGVKALMEFVWKDGHTGYYPSEFTVSNTTFTSGTQQLDNLKTWIDVIYSPLHADRADFTVRDRVEQFLESSLFTSDKIPNGPFTKFLRSLCFLAQDVNDSSDRLSDIYDISDCPDEYLPLLAELIGWNLFGTEPDRWRLQLRNAVDIYHRVGTKKGLQLAIDSLLPKEQFGIDTYISEVYESYVPYLIYYALATDSSYFKSFDTWSETVANEMQVAGYSTTSLDENLKLAVDRILLETYERFQDKFGEIPNQEKGFHYRGRTYPIPPFEEFPYYVNFELNKDIVEFIKDRLVCFGCTLSFANDFEKYLQDNALNVDDEPRSSSFLLFTSGYNDPPNLSNLIASGYNEKFEYASLWSGKSSHFKIVLDASSFNFNDNEMTTSSTGGSFLAVSKLAKDFIPAHAIPLINLEIAYIDNLGLVASSLPLVSPLCDEQETRNSRNHFTSGVYFNSYMRDVRTGGSNFSRNYTNNVDSANVLDATNATDIPRTSIRRRNYEKLLPNAGYYDRTGFNMPVGFDMASGVSGLPLGLVPSSLTYTPVTDHVNLPAIWNQCEGFNSANSYYEYNVSNTLNSRGASGTFPGNLDLTIDRGQLPDIYATMHSLQEQAKILEASATYGTATEYQLSVSNVYQAYANSATEYGGDFPNSKDDYYNYSFGRDLHRLYKSYVTDFNQHILNENIEKLDGANIFSHTFGPILYNHDFEDFTSDSDQFKSSILVSSLSATPVLTPKSTTFKGPLAYTDSSHMNVGVADNVLYDFISQIELVHTADSDNSNSFSVFNIPSTAKKSTDDSYMFDNTFILSRSTTKGLPRVRFDNMKQQDFEPPVPEIAGFSKATAAEGESNITIEKPDNVQKGDLLVVIAARDGEIDRGNITPSQYNTDLSGANWNRLLDLGDGLPYFTKAESDISARRAANQAGNALHLGIWYTIATGSEPQSQTIIGTDDEFPQLAIYLRITGASQTNPIGASSLPDFDDSSNLRSIPTCKTTRKNCLAIGYLGQTTSRQRNLTQGVGLTYYGNNKRRFIVDVDSLGETDAAVMGPDWDISDKLNFWVDASSASVSSLAGIGEAPSAGALGTGGGYQWMAPLSSQGTWAQFDLQGSSTITGKDKFFSTPSGTCLSPTSTGAPLSYVAALITKNLSSAGDSGDAAFLGNDNSWVSFQFAVNPAEKPYLPPDAPKVISYNSARVEATTKMSLNKPEGVKPGDLLLILAAAGHDDWGSAQTGDHFEAEATPTGWTRVISNQPNSVSLGGDHARYAFVAYYRVADGTESSVEGITSKVNSPHAVGIYYHITGASETDPIGVVGANQAEINRTERFREIPSLTTTSESSLCLGLITDSAHDGRTKDSILRRWGTRQPSTINGPYNGEGWVPMLSAIASPELHTDPYEGVSIIPHDHIMNAAGTETGALKFEQFPNEGQPFLGNAIEIKAAHADIYSTEPSIPSDRPIQENFLLPDHFHQAKARLLVSDNTGLNFGGRQVGMWVHTRPESGSMWSYDNTGHWVQHKAITTREDVINKFSHKYNIPVKTKDEIETEFTKYECIDNVALNSEVSPVSRLRKEDFEEITLDFDTRNRELLLPKDYRVNHKLLHRKDQNYVVEVFLIPNGDADKFMLLDTIEIQDVTLKKLSEIYTTGRYQDPLCVMPEVIGGCPEYRVELSKEDLRRVLRFFNDISGKNSKTGLASRDKTKTATIMGAEGGSKLDYRYRTEFFTVTPVLTTTLINSIDIDV